jgi:uncharacterized protein YqhQ
LTDKLIGGQAVIEGVLMKSDASWCVSVRKKDNSIVTIKKNFTSLGDRFTLFKIPFLRGVVNLFEMLFIGIKALTISSNIQIQDQESPIPSDRDDHISKPFFEPYNPEKGFSKWDLLWSFSVSAIIAVLIFMVLPHYIVESSFKIKPVSLKFHLFEGLIRFLFFFAYVIFISMFKDIKRVFKYHGAEHKCVYCYEANKKLILENAKKFSPYHPRCGTNFIFIVMITSIIIFSFIKSGSFISQIGLKLLLVPVIAGISYELLRLGAKIRVLSFLNYPGILFQRLTALEPDDSMIEVALRSLTSVLEMEKIDYVPEED